MLGMEENIQWGPFLEEVQEHSPEVVASFAGLDMDPERGFAEVLVEIVVARNEDELCFLHPPKLRLQAAQWLWDKDRHAGIPELTEYLRSHSFYDGETEEVVHLVEKIHARRLKRFLGLDHPEMLQVVHEDLYGDRPELDKKLDENRIQMVRLVAWATKDQVPLVHPRSLSTLEELVDELEFLSE